MTTNNNVVVLFGDSALPNSRPIGIYTLASYLRRHDIPTQTIWGWHIVPYHIFYGMCAKFLNDQVQVIGISSTLLAHYKPYEFDFSDREKDYEFFGMPADEVRRRFGLIKKFAPNAKIVVGGSQTVYDKLSVMPGAEFVDLFVRGQGEQAMLEIVRATMNNTKITTTSITPRMTSDKIYQFDEFIKTPVKFDPSDCLIPGEAMTIEFARGCIFKCSYCSYDLNGKSPGDYIKTKETLREELMYNYENFGTTYYYASDDMLNDSEEKVNLILEVSQSLPFKLTYSGFVRLDLIRRFPSMAQKLKDSGLVHCFMGIETINDASGRAVGKGLGLERTNQALDICDRAWNRSVALQAGLMLGLPKDTRETKDQLLDWLNTDLTRRVVTDVEIQPLFISPSMGLSEIDRNPEKFGYRYALDDNGTPKPLYGFGFMPWETDHYSMSEATADAEFVTKKFYENNQFSRIGIFEFPYMLSISDDPQDMMDIMFRDRSSKWNNNNHGWQNYLGSLYTAHRKKYWDKLLGKDK